jgi:hypothetical protein
LDGQTSQLKLKRTFRDRLAKARAQRLLIFDRGADDPPTDRVGLARDLGDPEIEVIELRPNLLYVSSCNSLVPLLLGVFQPGRGWL